MKKKLYRSKSNQMVAGVLAGFAEYFGHDATIWRLGFVFFLVMTGLMPGVLLYLLAWFVMPLEGENDQSIHDVEYEVVD